MRRQGYASAFTLHCSLQAGSGKMFVHAREADSPSNMRYMGLLVDKYVPDLSKAKGNSWAGGLGFHLLHGKLSWACAFTQCQKY